MLTLYQTTSSQFIVYPEVQPHVEYQLTDFGLRFMSILDSIEKLQQELEAER